MTQPATASSNEHLQLISIQRAFCAKRDAALRRSSDNQAHVQDTITLSPLHNLRATIFDVIECSLRLSHSTVTAANLYYNYSILDQIVSEFNITYQKASAIRTLMQVGYSCGILLLCPFGDRSRVRQLILSLLLLTAIMWISLCLNTSFKALLCC